MTEHTPPFSRRHGSPAKWIHEDFPQSARMALLHLLYDLVENCQVDGWFAIDKELRRISREPPQTYARNSLPDILRARKSSEQILLELEWDKVFDFCERLHSHLPLEDSSSDPFVSGISREEIQQNIAAEINRIFLEEHLAYYLESGLVHLKSGSFTKRQASNVDVIFSDSRLNEARRHYAKAVRYLEDRNNPDYENSIKEAVCSVESAAKSLFPEQRAKTLGEFVKPRKNSPLRELPPPIVKTIEGLYAFRSSAKGVGHGSSSGETVTRSLAEYTLQCAASQIILLHAIEQDASTDIPF